MRARDLGIVVGQHPTGPDNAITDVAGVRVGHVTVTDSEAVNTGVTVVVPHPRIWTEPVFAGAHRLNGSGEMTGLEWIRESGELTTAIGLTNTHSVGVVRDALVAAQVRERGEGLYWSLPVVGETYDGVLNDINGHHVRAEHVDDALARADAGPVEEGNVGGGTGMICHGFKGGIGSSSRVTETATGQYTVGVLVQANHGRRERLRVNGVSVGELMDDVPTPDISTRYEAGSGSIIAIVATDAPLLPHQCARLAQRAALGVARMGGAGEQYSGDLMLAFATGNRGIPPYAWDEDPDAGQPEIPLKMVAPQLMTRLFDLTIEATEEAILNALVAADTLTGRNGTTVRAIDHAKLREVLGTKEPVHN
ncbi:P1 family peptidase [Mycobacterium sp. 3519A]|uniref:DmpA family aminopeptidase n=1 Tax=Mycobacterium sp. 3519A TaxID=2057184 RepID=UPI000C7C12D8|nr:P1 family peptidase [Mycobacterium sp. 3519A]